MNNNFKAHLAILMVLFLALFSTSIFASETKWRSLKKGLEYTEIRIDQGAVHVFRIDPANYKFGVVTAKGLGSASASAKKFLKERGALVAVNGGFFTPEYESLGLIIDNGKKINPLKKTSWWSIFYIKNGKPYISHTNSFEMSDSISMAIQSGPRLVVDGRIPELKPSIAERSAVCVAAGEKVILIATENLLIQPSELAALLKKSEKEGGLGCRSALNLDGGSSTQMYAKIGSFKLDVPGLKEVANAVVVYPK